MNRYNFILIILMKILYNFACAAEEQCYNGSLLGRCGDGKDPSALAGRVVRSDVGNLMNKLRSYNRERNSSYY